MASALVSSLVTEAPNARTRSIDAVSTLDMCALMNDEDATVASAVRQCIPTIAAAVDVLASRLQRNGRVVYVGAGTSGHLGQLDASEMLPTFSVPSHQFICLVAGSDAPTTDAEENAEDDGMGGLLDIEKQKLDPSRDTVVGIAASGQTLYVLACLAYARKVGCVTMGITCNKSTAMSESGLVDFLIEPLTGPEVITGSTRLKAGTATKMVLNMLSTASMIKIGKTWGNNMVDMRPNNSKLVERSRAIIRRACNYDAEWSDSRIDALLARCNDNIKLAILLVRTSCEMEEGYRRLNEAGGVVSIALESSSRRKN